jgi:hypothetical protein
MGGIGVLHLDKFATALRLRWPWLEWKDDSKIWAGTGNPCNENDMEIFYAATTITLDNGRKTPFWQAPWLEGKMPKNIAPKIYEICKRKIGRFLKPYKMMNGLGSLVGRHRYLLNTSRNLFNFGPSFKMCT